MALGIVSAQIMNNALQHLRCFAANGVASTPATAPFLDIPSQPGTPVYHYNTSADAVPSNYTVKALPTSLVPTLRGSLLQGLDLIICQLVLVLSRHLFENR